MQLLEMRTQLRSRVGNPSVADASDSKLTEAINSSYLDIADRYRFHKARKRCQFDTVIGQARYDMPSDILAVLRISDETNHTKMEKWGDRQLSARINPTVLAKPLHYVRYRDWVELDPTPDGVYTMEVFYKFFFAKLVDDLDVPLIPPSWHEGIIRLAKFYYYEDIADLPKAASAYEAFKLWVTDKPTEIDEESVDIDSGVEILSLSQQLTPRQDFNHAD